MFGGAFIGSMVLLPVLLIGRLFGKTNEVVEESGDADEEGEDEEVQFGAQVPFGPMLAVAGLIYFLGFDVHVDAYFAQFAEMFAK